MVDFINKPILMHQLEALCAVGCREIVLAMSYMPETLKKDLEKWLDTIGNPKIHYIVEDVPMGTAGPLAVSADLLRTASKKGHIFVFNSDVTCDFPLHRMIEEHENHGGEGTIAVT